tara:strand:+ start:207 stop:608 length:402 start_codon:yes stop_codon:yes gene_type:complete
MAVQQIFGKRIIKVDKSHPNYDPKSEKEKEVSGNVIEPDENIYGEKHTYIPKPNGNLQMEQMMGKLMSKLDNFGTNSQTGVKPVEVDIKRELSIGKIDVNAVKSQEFKGKVKNKKNQLKALRHKRMYDKQRKK